MADETPGFGKGPAADPEFASHAIKLERRGKSTFRLVVTTTLNGKTETRKTDWMPRSEITAHAAQAHGAWGKFLLAGLGSMNGVGYG